MTIEHVFLAQLVTALDEAGVSYMLVGSLGSSFLGQFRSTNDADLVIAPTPEQLDRLLGSLAVDYYVDADTARQALRNRSMFNVIDFATGSKADLIVIKDRPFSREEFGRRARMKVLGVAVWAVTAEDAILSKLERSKAGESERQFQDALGVAIVQLPYLDMTYLRKWAVELEVAPLLDRLIAEIEAAKRPGSP